MAVFFGVFTFKPEFVEAGGAAAAVMVVAEIVEVFGSHERSGC
jgi:hypothetical protein